jgi:manganese/zinc/iron transport system permease protein
VDLWHVQVLLVVCVTAVACALPGVFLVLRRMALVSDAISHSILLGIVLAFFVTRDLSSPLLIAGAALTGLVTVFLVELLGRTGLVREDAAIGLVFPVLFSVGVILVSRYARNVHLDTDAVLFGAVEFAPLRQLTVAGREVGPEGLYVMLGVLLLNLLFIGAFYKELKLTTFDPGLGAALGFSPVLLHYALMALVSVTAVGAFDVVGSPLVVALMIGPPVAAYLLTDRLSRMLPISAALAVAAALLGYPQGVLSLARGLLGNGRLDGLAARLPDVSVAGAVATAVGVVFVLVLLFSPSHGLAAQAARRYRQRWEFAQTMLAIHLLHHEGRPEADEECRVDRLHEHLRWEPGFVGRVVQTAQRRELVARDGALLVLTPRGRELARQAMVT